MSKQTQVTYEVFAEAANQLDSENQRVSVRAVRTKVGGSNSKLMEFLRQWKSEKQLATETDEDISDGFRQALLAEFGRVVQKTRERLEEQLADEKNSAQEALDLLAEMEKTCAEQTEKITMLESQHQKRVLTLEKQIAGLEARLKDEESRETKLMQKVETLQASQHQAEINAAVAKSRCESLEKQLAAKAK